MTELLGQLRKAAVTTFRGDAPTELFGEAADRIEADAKELEAAQDQVVWGFYEERVPIFKQGRAGWHELTEPVTAEEVTRYVTKIEELTAERDALKARVEALKIDVLEALKMVANKSDQYVAECQAHDKTRAERDAAQAEAKRMREALSPFAELRPPEHWGEQDGINVNGSGWIKKADLTAARSALKGSEQP